MNRRRILIALAILTPLALFGAAKWATRWRPVVVGATLGRTRHSPLVRASARYVVAGDRTSYTRFDLQTGARVALQNGGMARTSATKRGGIAPTGAWAVERTVNSKGHWKLILTAPDGAARAYSCGGAGFDLPPGSGPIPNWEVENLAAQRLRVSPAGNRLELLDGYHYWRWNLASGALERQIALEQPDPLGNADDRDAESFALTRDGERAVFPVEKTLVWRSMRSGAVLTRVPLGGVPHFRAARVSPLGTYALFDANLTGATARWRVVETRTGRVLWSFDVGSSEEIAPFAPDETRIAVPLSQSKIWQIRDLATGKIIGTLPLVPDTNAAAFSPDGATLYSIAGGVLYRQRAR